MTLTGRITNAEGRTDLLIPIYTYVLLCVLRLLLSDRALDAAARSALRGALMDLDPFLREHGIAAARHEHPPVMTVEESVRLVPKLPGAKTKNLFLRDKKGARHFLVTVPHDIAVDLERARRGARRRRLGFASPERLLKHLGITPGSVSLLALVNDATRAVEFVIDRALWEAEAVQAHPLVNTATMVIAHADLERFLAATGHAPRVIDVPARRALTRWPSRRAAGRVARRGAARAPRRRAQVVRRGRGAARHLVRGRPRARRSASSGRRARASRRCSAASTA